MGNKQANNIQQQKIINHPRFYSSKIKDSDCIEVLMKINNENDYQNWQKSLAQIATIKDYQFYLLPRAYQIQKQSTCGSSFDLKIQYWNYQYILQQEIKNRAPFPKYFEEEQIWYLLYALTSASYHLMKLNKRVGDIRPINIFLNDQGQIKIANVFSWPEEIANYQKTYHDKVITYLSPQQLEQCRQGKVLNLINYNLSQTFSIGLTLLHSCLLQNMEFLYDILNYKFANHQLEKYFQQLINVNFISEAKNCQIKYSNQLKQAIIAMCQVNPKQRLSAESIYKWIKPFQRDIIHLKPLQIGRPPVIRQRISISQPINNSIQKIQRKVTNQIFPQMVQPQSYIPASKPINPQFKQQNYQLQYRPYNTQIKKPPNTTYAPNLHLQNNSIHFKPEIQPKHFPLTKQKLYTQPSLSQPKHNSIKGRQIIQTNKNPNISQNQQRVTSNSFYSIPQKAIIKSGNTASTNDLIKRIDEQLKRSKLLFP